MEGKTEYAPPQTFGDEAHIHGLLWAIMFMVSPKLDSPLRVHAATDGEDRVEVVVFEKTSPIALY